MPWLCGEESACLHGKQERLCSHYDGLYVALSCDCRDFLHVLVGHDVERKGQGGAKILLHQVAIYRGLELAVLLSC